MSELSESPRWQLPFLAVGQMQKEVTHNEALSLIDLLLVRTVETAMLNAPPSAPTVGQCWLVGAAPTGAWTEKPHFLAGWTSGGWRLIAPQPQMTVRLVDGRVARFDGAIWQVPPIVAAPGGGAVVDSEARAALASLISAMQSQGLLSPAS